MPHDLNSAHDLRRSETRKPTSLHNMMHVCFVSHPVKNPKALLQDLAETQLSKHVESWTQMVQRGSASVAAGKASLVHALSPACRMHDALCGVGGQEVNLDPEKLLVDRGA